MARHRTPPDADPDDWFADIDSDPGPDLEPERRTPRRSGGGYGPVHDDSGEDWLDVDDPDDPATGWNKKTARTVFIVLIVLAVLVVVGLAVGGVFSGREQPTTATTTLTTATHTATTSTTATTATTAPTTTATTTTTTTTTTSTLPAPTAELKPGAEGPEVKVLQAALTSLGYSVGAADGIYGPATVSGVKQFQAASNLTVDGICGPATIAALTTALQGP